MKPEEQEISKPNMPGGELRKGKDKAGTSKSTMRKMMLRESRWG